MAIVVWLLLLLQLTAVQQCAGDQPDFCGLDPEPGPCTSLNLQAFFNSTSSSCQWFVWGGCQGNKNRFATLKECRATCGDGSARSTCLLRLSSGYCLFSGKV